MAEVLGVVASGISVGALAGQIASTVMKLKSYSDQIRDAPEDIKIMVDEIENLHFLLSDIEDDRSRNLYSEMLVDNTSVLRCWNHCKRGVERLQCVVDEMAINFEGLKPMKRKFVSAKLVWKRDRLDKYRAELASAVRLLTLSCQIYTKISRLMQIESTDISCINSSSPLANKVQVQGHASSMQANQVTDSPRRMQPAWLRYKLCSLLLKKAWELEIFRSQRGWKFSLSTYAVVSSDSLVAKYTRDGNIEGLQYLFSRGEASPFTICVKKIYSADGGNVKSSSETLLEVGAAQGNYQVCEFLVNQGADLASSAETSMSPIGRFIVHGARYSYPYIGDSCKLASLLGSKYEITPDDLRQYRGPVSVFSALLKHMDVSLEDITIEQRCNLAIQLGRDSVCCPDLFLGALGCGAVPINAISYHGPDGGTLLHVVARAIGLLTFHVNIEIFDAEETQRRLLRWKSILQQLVEGGADLHATISSLQFCYRTNAKTVRRYDRITPLSYMLASSLGQYAWMGPTVGSEKALRFYITTLHEFGVDLDEYGLRESLIWEPLESEHLGDSKYYYKYSESSQGTLLGFTYGPEPGDWRVWENEPTDEFAGEFWEMLSKRVEVMPGTWID